MTKDKTLLIEGVTSTTLEIPKVFTLDSSLMSDKVFMDFLRDNTTLTIQEDSSAYEKYKQYIKGE